jgi:DNA invertase Pin-like site-specific DNA recombinase
MEHTKRAFAYLRVSGRGQVDGDGFPRQKAAIKAYAAAHGIRVAQYFEEAGVSGTKELEGRPALSAMLETILSNGVRVIIIEKLDRLARDLMIQETLLGEFRKHGIELVSVCEPDLCSDDPSRKLMRQLFGAIAEYEKSMIVLKLRGARQRMRAKTGSCEGRKAYGFTADERTTIARIREYAKNGLNFSQIALALNTEGVMPRAGRQWYPANISRILSRVDKVA